MQKLGTVKEIWRFPVKSMQGDAVPSCTVNQRGVCGDRVWAMRDETRSEIQWGKMFPDLMQCRARYREQPDGLEIRPVEITFPDGETVASDDGAVHRKLSELVGREATLQALQPAENVDFYKRYKPDEAVFAQEITDAFAREPGEPVPALSDFPEVLVDHVAVPGTFFDNEEIHFITTASIRYMQQHNPDANWDIRRFRPNFFIDSEEQGAKLVENEWLGRTIKLGEVVLEITAPTPRCGMTVRPQGDIDYDKSILRTIVREGAQCLGVGAHCRQAGTVRAGDAMYLLD